MIWCCHTHASVWSKMSRASLLVLVQLNYYSNFRTHVFTTSYLRISWNLKSFPKLGLLRATTILSLHTKLFGKVTSFMENRDSLLKIMFTPRVTSISENINQFIIVEIRRKNINFFRRKKMMLLLLK